MGRGHAPDEGNGRGMMKKPEIGIGAVIFRGNEVLMIRRGKAPRKGEWAIPGGRQELGETVAEGARREVLEETGVTCRIAGLIDVVDGISRHEDGSLIYHYTLIDMWGEWQAGDAVAASDVDFGITKPGHLKMSFAYFGGGLNEVSYEADDVWVREARAKLEAITSDIDNEEFEERPGDWCRHCDFLRFCEPGKAEIAQ